MKKLFSLLLCAGAALSVSAQQSAPFTVTLKDLPQCAFDKVLKKANVNYLDLQHAYRSSASAFAGAKTTDVVYDIPVVFHIVYSASTPTFNIPDSVVENQVAVLNECFRMRNADTGSLRSYFKPFAGDAEVQFHLATTDPQGNPTTGITRTVSNRFYFGSADGSLDSLERMKHTSQGGIDAWPTDKYLNIWVGNMSDSAGQLSVLGYGVPPLNPLPNNNWPAGSDAELASLVDGVVLQTHVVGSNSSLNAAIHGIYTKGRAAVHEVGHYLGLQHIFGSSDGSTATCSALDDDGIGDTPEQSTMSFDNNSGVSCPPATKNSCGSGASNDLPDMWEDYMDYARDACQVAFTKDQIAIMRDVLANQRSSLTNPVSVPSVPVTLSYNVYPNPATGQVTISFAGTVSDMAVYNFVGQKVMQLDGAAANKKQYDISKLPAGNYLMAIKSGEKQITSKFVVVK